jgi:uncharacterized membrane protein YhaH (DUF805 family)
MDLRALTRFDGRISRSEWWLGIAIIAVASWILVVILSAVFGVTALDLQDPAAVQQAMMRLVIPAAIIPVLTIYPTLALYTQRWHDRGKSGWWTLIVFIPLIGSLWAVIELGFLRGTEGPNQYGPDPLAH